MTKKFLSFFKYMTLVSVVFFFVAISGCDDDPDGPVFFDGTIMALISSDEFTIYMKGSRMNTNKMSYFPF